MNLDDGDDTKLIDVDLEAHDDEERLNGVSSQSLGNGRGEEEEDDDEESEATSDDDSFEEEGENTYIDD